MLNDFSSCSSILKYKSLDFKSRIVSHIKPAAYSSTVNNDTVYKQYASECQEPEDNRQTFTRFRRYLKAVYPNIERFLERSRDRKGKQMRDVEKCGGLILQESTTIFSSNFNSDKIVANLPSNYHLVSADKTLVHALCNSDFCSNGNMIQKHVYFHSDLRWELKISGKTINLGDLEVDNTFQEGTVKDICFIVDSVKLCMGVKGRSFTPDLYDTQIVDLLTKSSDTSYKEIRFRSHSCLRAVRFLHKLQVCSVCSCIIPDLTQKRIQSKKLLTKDELLNHAASTQTQKEKATVDNVRPIKLDTTQPAHSVGIGSDQSQCNLMLLHQDVRPIKLDTTQPAHNVGIGSDQSQCNLMTLHQDVRPIKLDTTQPAHSVGIGSDQSQCNLMTLHQDASKENGDNTHVVGNTSDHEKYQPFIPESDQILLESEAHSSEILKALYSMQKENRYCDVQVVTPLKTFFVHKVIVMATVPSLLGQQLPSMGNKYIIYIVDVLPSVFESVIHFMYTGQLKVKKSEVSLLRAFCTDMDLRSVLQLLSKYSDLKTINVTAEPQKATSESYIEDHMTSDLGNVSMSEQKNQSVTKHFLPNNVNVVEIEENVSKQATKQATAELMDVHAKRTDTKSKDSMSEIRCEAKMLTTKKECFSNTKALTVKDNLRKRLKGSGNNNIKVSGKFSSIRAGLDREKRAKNGACALVEPEWDHSYAVPCVKIIRSRKKCEEAKNSDKEQTLDSFEENANTATDMERKTLFSCTLCNKSFVNKRWYKLHMAANHEIEEYRNLFKNFTCNVCGKISLSKKRLAQHMINDHGEKDKKCLKLVKKQTCNICGYVFGKFQARLRHEFVKHGIQRRYGRKVVHQCSVCGKHLSSDKRLKFHKLRSHGIQTRCFIAQCQFQNCDFIGRDGYSLDSHVRSIHSNDYPYTCEICGKQFKSKGAVDKHVKGVHKNSCRICGKEMESKDALKSHLNQEHTREDRQPHLCHICSAGFSVLTALNYHLITAHNQPVPDDTKMYSCDGCSYMTPVKTYLEKHRKVHEGDTVFTCSVCKRAFSSEKYLKSHRLRSHADHAEKTKPDQDFTKKSPNDGKPPVNRKKKQQRKNKTTKKGKKIQAESSREVATGTATAVQPSRSTSPQGDDHSNKLRKKKPIKRKRKLQCSSDRSDSSSKPKKKLSNTKSNRLKEENIMTSGSSTSKSSTNEPLVKRPDDGDKSKLGVKEESYSEVEDNLREAFDEYCEQSPNKLLKLQLNQSEETEITAEFLRNLDFLQENFAEESD